MRIKKEDNIYIPDGYTEETLLAEIDKVVKLVIAKMRPFGYFSKQDIYQTGVMYAIESLSSGLYDSKRSLGAFLRTAITNKFITFHRDKVFRAESPCLSCVFYDKHYKKSTNQCSAFENKLDCKKFDKYIKRNKTKQDLMNLHMSNMIFDNHLAFDCAVLKQMEDADMIAMIKKHLIPTHRKWLDSLLLGHKLKPNQMEALKASVLKIMQSERF